MELKAANDNEPLDRKPGETGERWLIRLAQVGSPEAQDLYVRSTGNPVSPLEREHRLSRVPIELMKIADTIEEHHQIAREGRRFGTAHPGSVAADILIGSEHAAHSDGILLKLEDACGHLWRAILMAVIGRSKMEEIGRHYSAAKENAPAIGREKVIDGLKLAARSLRRIEQEERGNYHRAGIAA